MTKELITKLRSAFIDIELSTREAYTLADTIEALQARVAELERQNKDLDRSETQLIQERDEREEVINALCDTVLGTDRYEWSSMYSFDDAVEEVAVKTAVLDKEVSELYALRKENAKLAAELTAIKNQEPVAWCELSIDGKHIAHFDGKPVIMAGPVGNDCHRTPLFAKPTPAQVAAADLLNARHGLLLAQADAEWAAARIHAYEARIERLTRYPGVA